MLRTTILDGNPANVGCLRIIAQDPINRRRFERLLMSLQGVLGPKSMSRCLTVLSIRFWASAGRQTTVSCVVCRILALYSVSGSARPNGQGIRSNRVSQAWVN
jgi:hypothetical protein